MSSKSSIQKRKSLYTIINLNEYFLILSKHRNSRDCLKIHEEDFYSFWYTDINKIVKEIERQTAITFGKEATNVSCQPDADALEKLQKIACKNIAALVESESECS